MNKPISIRPGTADDASFIFSSWLKSYRQSYFARTISNTIYFDQHHAVLRRLIKRCSTDIACNPEDPSQIYGYIVHESVTGIPVVHYVYVKQTFRNMGIGKALLEKAKTFEEAGVYTHHTKMAEKLAAKHSVTHHPYLALESDQVQPTKES